MTRKVEQTFNDACLLTVAVLHNGFQGGDSGHGGYVKITIKDSGSVDLRLNGEEVKEFDFELRGDAERRTLVEAFHFILKELEENTGSRSYSTLEELRKQYRDEINNDPTKNPFTDYPF